MMTQATAMKLGGIVGPNLDTVRRNNGATETTTPQLVNGGAKPEPDVIARPERQPTRRVLEPLIAVARRHDLVDVASRLDRIRLWIGADLDDLEGAIAHTRADQSDLGRRAAEHLLAQPGKRIRPLLVFLTARLGEPVAGNIVRDLAVASELAHAATLLHDDVIDQGMERRGAPTSRMIFGNSASVLGGDHLLVETLRRVERCGHPELLRGMIEVISDMVTAEALQLDVRGRFIPDEDVYQRVVAGKTAVLFCWAMRAGATAAQLPPAQIEALSRAGEHLGLAFQLVDDALDLADDPTTTGKDTLLDLREGKLTWPLLIACRKDPALLSQLQAVAAEPELLDDATFATKLRRQILATGCVEATRQRATAAADAARLALSVLPASGARDALDTVVEAAVERCR